MRSQAALLGLLVLLLAASIACSETRRVEVEPGIVTLDVPIDLGTDDGGRPNQEVSWESRSPITLNFNTAVTADGKSICFFCLGNGGKVALQSDSIFWSEHRRKKITWIVTAKGDPDTPDPVDPDPIVPRPEGFAGEVFDQARRINDKANAGRLSEAYLMVATKIAAGGLKTLDEVRTDITNSIKRLQLPRTWSPFGDWINRETNSRAQSLDQAKELFRELATGLEAAAK